MTGSPAIVLASGGTGGHLFPAEALAHELLARGYRVALLTDARGLAFADRVSGAQVIALDVRRTDGSAVSKALAIGSMAIASVQAMRHLQKLAPAAVVGFGGYPSLPTVMAASLMAIPVILHEQNALLGRANKLTVLAAAAIASAFPTLEGLSDRQRRKLVHTGNPVRPDFQALRNVGYQPPLGDEPISLLITGGSQGATVFADVVPAALARLPEALRRRLRVAQQCRAEDLARTAEAYHAAGIKAETEPFLGDIPSRLNACHLAIGRGGASTIAELAIVGRPALLVPLPHATDDHQSANAWAFESHGGGAMIKQKDFTADYLATRLEAMLGDPERLRHMAAAAHAMGRPQAASVLADLVGNTIEGRATADAA